jgi:hypothetical protein
MEEIFDIFRRLPDGDPLWVQAVDGFAQAESALRHLASTSSGDYFIFDSRTASILPGCECGAETAL